MNINTVSFLVAGLMCSTVIVLTDNGWYLAGVVVYGLVMNLLGFADGLKHARK